MKTANTVFGKSSGKLAGVVASSWKGINVVREKPLTVNQPNSNPQLGRRSIMRQAVAMAKANLPYVQSAFAERAVKKSAYNAAVSSIIKGFIVIADRGLLDDPTKIKTASGSLANVLAPVLGSAVGHNQTITWSNNANGSNILSTDTVRAAAITMNSTTGEVKLGYSVNTFLRSAASGAFSLPADLVMTDIAGVYIFTERTSEKKASDSVTVA